MKPSLLAKRMFSHQGNVSESSKAQILATCKILNKKVTFYKDGTHIIQGKIDLTEEEMFNSNILRYAHASLLIREPVGDKRKLWVDATVDPVNIWVYGLPIQRFLFRAKMAIKRGEVSADFILDQHPDKSEREIKNERDVRLFGRHFDQPSIQDGNIFKTHSCCDCTVHYRTD